MATSVFDPEGINPDFTYSTGFTKTLGSPEVIVFGLDRKLMHSMIWNAFRDIQKGATLKDGGRWADLLEGFDCYVKRAEHAELFTEYAVSADWFWRHMGHEGHPEVFQIVWPGAQQGLFPWDEGCDPYVISQQPKLWRS